MAGLGAEYWSRGGRRMIDILGRDVILPLTGGRGGREARHQIRKWPLAETVINPTCVVTAIAS